MHFHGDGRAGASKGVNQEIAEALQLVPRITLAPRTRQGVVVFSGCLNGRLPRFGPQPRSAVPLGAQNVRISGIALNWNVSGIRILRSRTQLVTTRQPPFRAQVDRFRVRLHLPGIARG